jgi:hypothetical protein
MCLLLGTNWVYISQKTTYLIVTAVKTSNLTNRRVSCVFFFHASVCGVFGRESWPTDANDRRLSPGLCQQYVQCIRST